MGWNSRNKGLTALGDRLKQERKRRGFDQVLSFADICGLDQSVITGIENRGVLPKIPSLIKICEVLECSTDWLLGLEE